MAGNSFGRILRLTSYGESHGPGLGGVLDGCPAGLPLSEEDLQRELDLRKPGQGATATKRKEPDTVRILSGVFQGLTTGTPIAFHIANEDQRSRDSVHFIHDAIYSVLSSARIAEFNLNIIPYLIKVLQCSRRIVNLTLHLHGP